MMVTVVMATVMMLLSPRGHNCSDEDDEGDSGKQCVA